MIQPIASIANWFRERLLPVYVVRHEVINVSLQQFTKEDRASLNIQVQGSRALINELERVLKRESYLILARYSDQYPPPPPIQLPENNVDTNHTIPNGETAVESKPRLTVNM